MNTINDFRRAAEAGLMKEICPYCGDVIRSLHGQSRVPAHTARRHPGGVCESCSREFSALGDDGLCITCRDSTEDPKRIWDGLGARRNRNRR